MPQQQNQKSLSVRYGAYSDTGRVRAENEDAYGRFALPSGEEELFVVADGMGGHSCGREASRAAVDAIKRAFFRGDGEAASVEERLEQSFREANASVLAQAAEAPGQQMGTTCTALVLTGRHAVVAHVGDSRLYRLRKQPPAREVLLKQLTQDHTAVAEMQREGMLTEAEARTHPRRHILARAMGLEAALKVDVLRPEPPQSGDRYLLCTDGLLGVPEVEIAAAAGTDSPQLACEELVRRANALGGHDNVTVLLIALD